jgi:imidazolonepropionase-like amidohydrolase
MQLSVTSAFLALLTGLHPQPTPQPSTQPAPAAAAATSLKPLDASVTAFTNVDVLTMTDAGTLRRCTVIIKDGRIEDLGPALKTPEGARTIDGAGKFLIPGLCDMHVHIPPARGDKGDPAWRALTLLLANGVTTCRGMVGHDAHIPLRQRIADGDLLAPTTYMASPLIFFQATKSPEQAAEQVKAYKAKGFDLIKSHRVISPEVYQAAQDTAREVGIPVAGHVDNEVGLDRALKAGQQIEHLDSCLAELVDDAELRNSFGQMATAEAKDAADLSRIPAVVARIKQAGVYSTPTLALFERIADTTTPTADLRARAEMKYLHPQALEGWSKQREGMVAQGPFVDKALGEWFVATRRRFVKELQAQGAPIMAGSDSPQAFGLTGFALHEELAALNKAGLTPLETLRAASATPAAYLGTLPSRGSALGWEPDFGQIAKGKRADLVLLSADPTRDIAAARHIEGVMLRGKYLDRVALDHLLAEVAESVKPG